MIPLSEATGRRRSTASGRPNRSNTRFVAMFMLLYIWSSIPLRGHLEDEAFETEQQWASVLQQVVAKGNPDEISETLRTVRPEVLEGIHADALRTPPMLRELAEQEQARRSGESGGRGGTTDR
ncbi:MAG: hypothetical protein WBL35_16660 [Ornithinibacter sp.]